MLWQSLLGERTEDFWEDFCEAFEEMDPEFSKQLTKLKLPLTAASQREFLRLFRGFFQKVSTPVILVLDQVTKQPYHEVRQFFHFFVRMLPESFHLVMLGQAGEIKNDPFFQVYGIVNLVGQEEFEFLPRDITAYFKKHGVTLQPEKVRWLYEYSSGWIAAIRMNLQEYQERGSFLSEHEMFEILDRTLLSSLDAQKRKFLQTVSVAEHFSIKQAEFLWQEDNADQLLEQLRDDGLYIRYDRVNGSYCLTPALQAYFRDRNAKLSQKEQDELLNRLAEWYLKSDENALARRLYHRIKNFDALMDAVEKRRFLVMYGLDEQEFISYYTDCPAEIRARHPKAILTFARQMFALGAQKMGQEVCAEFEEIMENRQEMDEEDRSQLMGTYELLLSYAQYNRLEEMLHHTRKAQALLKDRTTAILWPDTGFNDSLSILYMYHRTPGELEKEEKLFAEYGTLYSGLIGGRLAGGGLVFQGERLYLAGDIQGAEIATHRALLTVHRDRQRNIWLCTVMLQIRIALAMGNWHTIAHLLEEVKESVAQKKEHDIIPATDFLETFLYSKLGQPQRIHLKFDTHLSEKFTLCFRSAPMFYCIQAEAMLARRDYVQVLALAERHLESTRIYPNIYAEIICHIEIAGAYEGMGKIDEAKSHLLAALKLAVPDQILAPFVELGHYISETFSRLSGEEFAKETEEISSWQKTYKESIRDIVAEHFSETTHGLTGRETEIAKLAAKRLSNKEIADYLVISESTVKTQLARAFSKLNIKKRRDLNQFFPEK